jgi:hypothetical protein
MFVIFLEGIFCFQFSRGTREFCVLNLLAVLFKKRDSYKNRHGMKINRDTSKRVQLSKEYLGTLRAGRK